MSTVSILSILVYPQSGYLLVYHMGLSLVHCSYLSIGSLHADGLRKELRRQRAPMRERVPPSQRRRIRDDDCEEENHQDIEFIHSEANFNYVKIHLMSHFRDHIHMFSNIPMYSTKYELLAHKAEIKDGDTEMKWMQHNRY